MEAHKISELTVFEDDTARMTQVVNTADCPDCGSNKAKYITRKRYTHTGIPHDGYSVTIDCPVCAYHEYMFIGPDI